MARVVRGAYHIAAFASWHLCRPEADRGRDGVVHAQAHFRNDEWGVQSAEWKQDGAGVTGPGIVTGCHGSCHGWRFGIGPSLLSCHAVTGPRGQGVGRVSVERLCL